MAEANPTRTPLAAQRRRRSPKKKYIIEEKKKIMKMIKDGIKTVHICRAMNVPESTVRSMKRQQATLPATLDIYAKYGDNNKRMMTSERSRLLSIVEHYLVKWITRRDKDGVSLSGPQIRKQAMVFYNALVEKKKVSNPPSFTASIGWLTDFKKRCGVKFATIQGEARSADTEAAKELKTLTLKRKQIQEKK